MQDERECEVCGETENVDYLMVKQASGVHGVCQNCSAMDVPEGQEQEEDC